MTFNVKEIISVTLILFSVIDVIGSLPVIIDLRQKVGTIESEKATFVSGVLMVSFLFLGERLLNLFGVDVSSFAVAGALIIFLIGLEMILGRTIFKSEVETGGPVHIVPIAFPLIAGAGTLTTLISLRAEYQTANIIVGIILNLILIYIVLKSSGWLETRIGPGGLAVLRKVFGIILLAISIKLLKTNLITEF
ncbi:MAG: MarC family protein [Rudanella sp.]|nr:MarC family protein [Rudanella sp.]